MAFKIADRVRETTTTTGTGDFTLAGATAGYSSFSSRLSVGDTTFYAAVLGTQWEVGLGTLTAATTLARTTVLSSSNGDAAVNFASGTKDIFLDAPAFLLANLLRLDAATSYTAAQISTGLGNLGVSAFIKTLLTQTDAASARSTLGVFAITAFSLGANGYVKFSNGSTAFLLQWGSMTITGGDVGVTFPVNFSANPWVVVPSSVQSTPNSATSLYMVSADGYLPSSFAAHGRYASNGGVVGTAGVAANYFAIGPANP